MKNAEMDNAEFIRKQLIILGVCIRHGDINSLAHRHAVVVTYGH